MPDTPIDSAPDYAKITPSRLRGLELRVRF
jgi:hypothetical protein